METLAAHGGTPVRTKPFPAWPIFGETEEKLLLEVLHSGRWGGADKNKLEELERKFAAIHGAKFAVNVANGTMAITVALMAAGVEPGDEVIMPPYTFIATASAALLFGAIPVFVDVEEDTLLIDPEKIEAAITPKTKAIAAVHIGGAMANMTRLKEIAAKHGLKLIEDAAQAAGARWEGQGAGSFGDAGTFSLQASKNINAGEGGIILTNDQALSDRIWSLANVGRVRQGGWYQHEILGWNLRMTEFQAAIALGQLTRLEEQIAVRERNARLLTELLQDIEGIETLKRDPRVTTHAYHLYIAKLSEAAANACDKAEFVRLLQAEGIPASPGYISLNRNKAVLQAAKRWTGEDRVYPCPISERLCEKQAFWLPQQVLLADEEAMHDVAAAIRKVLHHLVG
jgi:dTDP-4-amino-4,6-dideoxygalactose transaminase